MLFNGAYDVKLKSSLYFAFAITASAIFSFNSACTVSLLENVSQHARFVKAKFHNYRLRGMQEPVFNFENVRKILVAADGSDCGVRAAEQGIGIAKLLDAQVVVVYVVDEVALAQVSKVSEHAEAETELKKVGQRCINYILDLAKKEGVQTGSLLAKLAEGRPYDQIVRLAKQLKIDLIVMGTRGQRSAERVLMGSVAQKVIEFAPCPVLVVK